MKHIGKKFLPSLAQENLIHEQIFSVPFIKGLNFSSTTKISEDSTASYEFFLQPLTFTFSQTSDGNLTQKRNLTTAAKVTYVKANENGKIIFSFGTNPLLLINLTPLKQLPFTVQMNFGRGIIRPTFSTSFRGKYFHPVIKTTLFSQPLISVDGNRFKFYDPSLIETIDFSFMAGTNELSGGLQLVKRFDIKDPSKSRVAFSALMQGKWSKNMAEIAIVKDPVSTFVWRFQRKVNDSWSFGTTFNVTSQLTTNALFAYKAEIGRSTVQGLVTTTQIVESSFTRKINDNFNFTVSSFLDHSEKNYYLGMSFSYDN